MGASRFPGPDGIGAAPRGYPWAALLSGVAALTLVIALMPAACRWQAAVGLESSTDLLLAHLPLVDLRPWLIYGWWALHPAFFATVAVCEPRRLPHFAWTLALLLAVRNVFLALTPVAMPRDKLLFFGEGPLAFLRNRVAYDNEIFFSGHTAVPFLYFLLCRRPGGLRWVYLVVSAANAAGVLLTKNHYAIDVLGAFFITHSVHILSRRLLGRLDSI